jgi:hypothetical protein
MFTVVKVRSGNRHLTINVPKGVDEITVEFPAYEEKPLIILTDK